MRRAQDAVTACGLPQDWVTVSTDPDVVVVFMVY